MPDVQPCGTWAAYQRHKRRGEQACPACLQAQARYQRERLAGNPHLRDRRNASNAARSRAVWRLAAEHPDRFQELYIEEFRSGGGVS